MEKTDEKSTQTLHLELLAQMHSKHIIRIALYAGGFGAAVAEIS